jgi:hypothetical protein
MKVPNHLYVLGDTYTCHTYKCFGTFIIKDGRYTFTFVKPFLLTCPFWLRKIVMAFHILADVNIGLFKIIVRVLTTCHTQYTWDRSIYFFYLIEQNSKVLLHIVQVLYMCTLCDSTSINMIIEFVPQKTLAAILVNCAPSGGMHNYCTPHIIKENFENFLIHRCNYILLSQVYCVWQVVKTPTVISITLYRMFEW